MIHTGSCEQEHIVDHHVGIKRAVHDLPAAQMATVKISHYMTQI